MNHVIAFCLLLVSGHLALAKHHQIYRKIRGCTEQSGYKMEDFSTFIDQGMENGEVSDEEAIFIGCVMEAMHIIEDGKVNAEKIKDKAPNKAAEECMGSATGSTNAEIVNSLFKCVKEQ